MIWKLVKQTGVNVLKCPMVTVEIFKTMLNILQPGRSQDLLGVPAASGLQNIIRKAVAHAKGTRLH